MQKKTLALALATAFAAPSAFADVEIGPFAIYGRLHSALEVVSVSGPTTPSTMTQSQSRLMDQASRLGFKVKHDLGNGQFALGQIESRLYLGNNGNATDDKAELGSRNTFVGLGSDAAGTLRLGRYDNAYKLGLRQISDTLYSNLNDSSSDYGKGQILNRLGDRQGDVIAYESPKFGGFTVIASHNLGKDSTNSISGGAANNTAKNTVATDLMPQFALGLGYAAGDFTVGLSYTTVANANWKLDGSSAAKAVNTLTGAQKLSSYQLGGQYRFGKYSVGAVAERVSSSLEGAGAYDQTQDSYGLVGGYKDGALTLQLRHAIANDVANTTATDTGATQTGVAVAYQLNKYVSAVGSVTSVNNKKNASYTSFSGFTLDKGNSMTQVALGLAVAF